MKCPSCNQLASTWQRNAFSMQGVTLMQSFKGLLRCQHCGVLLRPVKYSRQLWLALMVFVVTLSLVILFSDRLYRLFGLGAVGIYWVLLIGMACFTFVYGLWKYAVLQRVDEDKPKADESEMSRKEI
jgi:hypothetical protein